MDINKLSNPKNNKTMTSVGVMLLIYVTLWSCNNHAVILYGGYGILLFFAISKLFFSERGAVVEMYTPTRQLFTFMSFCFLSAFWAINSKFAVEKAIFIFACVLLVIVMSNYFVRIKSIDSLLITIAAIGIVLAIYVFITEGGFSAFYSKATSSVGKMNVNRARVGGEITNVNFIGVQCAYSAVVLFYYAYFQKKRLCYFIFIVPAVVTISTGSKTALITILAGVFLTLYFQQKNQKTIQKYLKVLIGVIATVFIIRFIFTLDIMYTISRRFEYFIQGFLNEGTSNGDGSTDVRSRMITIGLEQFLQAPALGIGLGNSVMLNAAKLNFPTYSHCDYIEHLVNGGLIGFLLYYRIFFYFIKNYRVLLKKDSDSRIVISYVILILILINNISSITYYNRIHMYIFFILWTSQVELKRREGVLSGDN